MKYAWIKEHIKDFNITVMCKVLKVDRSSYYHWIKTGCVVKKVDKQLNELIRIIFRALLKTHSETSNFPI